MQAKKGDWVEIENIVLSPEERSDNLPEDTRRVPLIMWVKGFLESNEAVIGDNVIIITLTGRKVSGKLVEIEPKHRYDYGDSVPELIRLGQDLKREFSMIRKGGMENE